MPIKLSPSRRGPCGRKNITSSIYCKVLSHSGLISFSEYDYYLPSVSFESFFEHSWSLKKKKKDKHIVEHKSMFSQKYPISVNQYEWETTHPNQSRFCFSLFHCDLDYWTWNVSSQYCHGNTIRYCAALPVGGEKNVLFLWWNGWHLIKKSF